MMTVSSMDNSKTSRKSSWDSKMSISTVSSGPRHFRRTPSSILSSDSDIRFTRKKLTSQYRCGCCIIASFLCLLLVAAAAVYVGYTYFTPDAPSDQIFRATFRVIVGDTFTPDLADPNNPKFQNKSQLYNERLNLLFRRSPIRHGLVSTEVLALDGTEDEDLIVHFNVETDPYYVNVNAEDVEKILRAEIVEPLYFQNLTIDYESIEVHPVDAIPEVTSTTTVLTTISTVTTTPIPKRQCAPLSLKYCEQLNYNITTYPNLLGHQTITDVRNDVIAFRELVDAECYRHAYEFVCQVLQPACKQNTDGDQYEMLLPCRSFCRDFMVGCSGRLSEKFKELLNCSRFPEYEGMGTCVTKPACVEMLQSHALSPRICDGVIDCQDLSDEKQCTYCPTNYLHCGLGRNCIPENKRCDGRQDCPDGSDEFACLNLIPNVNRMRRTKNLTPHPWHYSVDGFVTFNEKGEIGKLCTENLNRTLNGNRTMDVLQVVATSLCKSLSYQNVKSVQIAVDQESNISYVEMKNPLASEITFLRTSCPTKQVLKVSCSNLECGIQTTHHHPMDSLPKLSMHGDWPWHAALFKEEVHICDGTLISDEWLVTTTSCFQGQPKAEWTARFGTIRLTSSPPWEQERRIVGMIKSPVEGSTIAMIKLDRPIIPNDFVRPICLPDENMKFTSDLECNTLGWAMGREQLQRVQVKIVGMQKCENISISSVNSFCTETYYGKNDCNEEEFAGSPMVCSHTNGDRWNLVGITNWRIACSKNGTERPRMYDKITSNVKWIQETINADNSP